MKRWWLAIALLLSLGFNIGLLTATWIRSLQPTVAADVSTSAGGTDRGQPQVRQQTDRIDQADRMDQAARGDRTDRTDRTPGNAADVAPAPGERPQRPSDRGPLTDVAPPSDTRMTEPERLAHRLGLEGEERQRFVALQVRLRRSLRERLPQLARLRRQLYREMVAPVPDGARLRRLTERMAWLNVEIERELVRTVVASRELMDPRQEEIYRRYLATRMGPLQQSLAPGPARGSDRLPGGSDRLPDGSDRLPNGSDRPPNRRESRPP